jgi:hypothetical protein
MLLTTEALVAELPKIKSCSGECQNHGSNPMMGGDY